METRSNSSQGTDEEQLKSFISTIRIIEMLCLPCHDLLEEAWPSRDRDIQSGQLSPCGSLKLL